MSVHETAQEIMKRPRTMEFWKAVEDHPLGEVIPGLVAITAAQWKFWNNRPLIVQSNVITGSGIIELAREETQEKNEELIKLNADHKDTSPLMVAMEAADELVFLCSYVGFYPDDKKMWREVGEEALTIAYGAIETIYNMRARANNEQEKILSNISKFVAEDVIANKNVSNYHPAYFAPIPPKYGSHNSSKYVEAEMVTSTYGKARSNARLAREAIKQQELYNEYGMPNHLGLFAKMNGHTPEPWQSDNAVRVLQASLREHYRYYAHTFGEIGVDYILNYFRVNNPPMMNVVKTAIESGKSDR